MIGHDLPPNASPETAKRIKTMPPLNDFAELESLMKKEEALLHTDIDSPPPKPRLAVSVRIYLIFY